MACACVQGLVLGKAEYIADCRLNAFPNQAIMRASKVCKEESQSTHSNLPVACGLHISCIFVLWACVSIQDIPAPAGSCLRDSPLL